MSVASLVPDRYDDVERLPGVGEAFAFAPDEPAWAPLAGERPRAAGKLLAFVAAAGVGSGLALWMLGEVVANAVRGMF